MATVLRPIGHEDQLSVVDHLDELRKRLIICVAALVVAFGFAFWQNGRILDVINAPYTHAVATQSNIHNPQSLDRLGKVAASLIRSRPALQQQQRALVGLAHTQSFSPQVRSLYAQQAQGIQRQLDALPTQVPAPVPVTLGIAEPFTATVTIAAYAAVLLALPVILYQLYAFVLPAFRPEEKRSVIPLMGLVPVLFAAGVAFGYFLILPAAVGFLQTFNHSSFDVLVQARPYYKFSVVLLLVMGLIFQLPVGMLALNRVGIISSKFLRQNWRYATVITVVIAALGPGVDPVSTLLEWIPLMFLYGLSIVLVMLAERRARKHAATQEVEEGDLLFDLDQEE